MEQQKLFQCPKCHQKVQQVWISCPNCGSTLPPKGKSTPVREESQAHLNGKQKHSKRRKNAWVWVLIGGVGGILLFIMCLGGAVYLQTQSIEQETARVLETEQVYATENAGVLFGPWDGTLEHHPSSTSVFAHCAGASLRNFRVTVTFYAPYSVGLNSWDFGIYFRDTGGNHQYRLQMFSDGGWNLVLVGDPSMAN